MTAHAGEDLAIGHAVKVAEIDPVADRPGWLALRRRGLGGSDAAAICGQSRYKSALEVWLEKTGVLGDDDRDNEAMYWGRTLEPLIADAMVERTGVELTEVGALLRHPEHEWMLASVDRAAHDRLGTLGYGLGEMKSAGHYAGQDWADGAVPDAYALQGMHYLATTGLPWVLFGCLIGGQRLEVRWLFRDEELIAHLVDLEAEFWRHVVEQVPPAPDGSKATTELLAHLYEVKTDAVVTLDPAEVDPLIEMRSLAAAAEKAAKEQKALAENRLRVAIGENEIATTPDGRILFTWKQHDRSKVDLDGLRAEAPELVAKHTTAEPQRRLYIPKRKAT